MTKLTKKEKFQMALELAQQSGNEFLAEFFQSEMDLLDKRYSRKSTKEKAVDELKVAIVSALDTDEFRVCPSVLAAVHPNFPEATSAKVSSRLSALVREGLAEKQEVKVGKSRLVGYRLVQDQVQDQDQE